MALPPKKKTDPNVSEKENPVLPAAISNNPSLKQKAESFLSEVSPEQKKKDYEKFQMFVRGEITWAEIKGFPKYMLKELSTIAYTHYKTGDYRLAESLFKGLAIIDHVNWYYRSALGAIYQKQKLYEQAIEEYDMALTLNTQELSSLTNRGECQMRLNNFSAALADFDAALALDPQAVNSWTKRAQRLKQRLNMEGRGRFNMED